MKFEKQVEEMAKIIRETTFIRGFEYSAAAGIFAAGYGKVKEERLEAYKEGYEQGKFDAAIEAGNAQQKEREKEIEKQEAFAQEMGFAPDASPYYIARKYKEKFEYAMKELAEARKETFMEIMEMLRFGYELPIDDIAREMAKEYGVEVEE